MPAATSTFLFRRYIRCQILRNFISLPWQAQFKVYPQNTLMLPNSKQIKHIMASIMEITQNHSAINLCTKTAHRRQINIMHALPGSPCIDAATISALIKLSEAGCNISNKSALTSKNTLASSAELESDDDDCDMYVVETALRCPLAWTTFACSSTRRFICWFSEWQFHVQVTDQLK